MENHGKQDLIGGCLRPNVSHPIPDEITPLYNLLEKPKDIRGYDDSKFRAAAAELCTEMATLVADKNLAYGNSFEDIPYIVRILYPDGIKPEQYEDALGIIRVLDKMKRIATDRDAFGENPWKDIMGYGIVSLVTEKLRNTK